MRFFYRRSDVYPLYRRVYSQVVVRHMVRSFLHGFSSVEGKTTSSCLRLGVFRLPLFYPSLAVNIWQYWYQIIFFRFFFFYYVLCIICSPSIVVFFFFLFVLFSFLASSISSFLYFFLCFFSLFQCIWVAAVAYVYMYVYMYDMYVVHVPFVSNTVARPCIIYCLFPSSNNTMRCELSVSQ